MNEQEINRYIDLAIDRIDDLRDVALTEQQRADFRTLLSRMIHEFPPDDESDGAHLILAERGRQKSEEGWTSSHDDEQEHGELAIAAACYAVTNLDQCVITDPIEGTDAWPWDHQWDKRQKHGRIKRLKIAGALIAAEIDRLRRQGVTDG